MERKSRACAACGSEELHSGSLTAGAYGVAFVPEVSSWLTFAPMLRVRALVCTTCGFVAHYLDEEALEKVKQKRT